MNAKANPANLPAVGDMVICTNYYTGRSHSRKVVAISETGTKLSVERLDWKTGRCIMWLKPSLGIWKDEYSSEVVVRKST